MVKVEWNCGSLTPSTEWKSTTTRKAAVADVEAKSDKQNSKYHTHGEESKLVSSDSEVN